jgi:hypothetical protein
MMEKQVRAGGGSRVLVKTQRKYVKDGGRRKIQGKIATITGLSYQENKYRTRSSEELGIWVLSILFFYLFQIVSQGTQAEVSPG